MAITKTLAQRLFKRWHQALTRCRISSTAAVDPGDKSLIRRLLLPGMMEQLRGMDIVGKNRIRLEGWSGPPKLTVAEARKVLRVTQLEMVKERIRGVGRSSVSYEEFVEICVSGGGGSRDLGLEFAKMMDQSGTVIVLGNLVFLRPDHVVKAVRGLIPTPVVHLEDPRRNELEEMEQQKFMIDQKAESMVRRELWCGLGYLVVQTVGFMRLTFWELSWDVMEPICFYVTSTYFMAGYAFFLRTAKEPSFEGFFHSRYETKQKKLMKLHNFDLRRYNELREACYPHPWPREKTFSFAPMNDETNASLGEYN